MTEPNRALLTVADVAEILQMRRESVHNWIHQGRGPRSFKIGRRRFFDARDVDAWILEQKLTTASA
ncbi:helix-turn-helix domain-containing protein [Nocardia salmonicida]|uniref:helix-turn-helix transcriptional regulator n=1 Tax=Nocardia salmonicida TaxID=53431 RepID=UPI0033C4C8A7